MSNKVPPIPRVIAKLDDAPVPLRPFFEERQDGWHLRLDDPEAGKLAEFRDSNRALNAKLTAAEERLKEFEGIDPVAAREALAQVGNAPEQARKLTELTAQLEREQQAHRAARLSHAVGFEFLGAGGEPGALEFIVAKAEKAGFRINEKGDVVTDAASEANPAAKLTLGEWMQGLTKSAHWAFRKSRGGGAATTAIGAPSSKPTVSRHDVEAVGRHLADIASGAMALTD